MKTKKENPRIQLLKQQRGVIMIWLWWWRLEQHDWITLYWIGRQRACSKRITFKIYTNDEKYVLGDFDWQTIRKGVCGRITNGKMKQYFGEESYRKDLPATWVGYISEKWGAMVSTTILIGVHFSVHSRLPKCRKPHQLRKGTEKKI